MLEPILDVLVLCPKSRRPGVKLEGKRKVVCGRYGAREGRRSLYLALITQGRISSTGPWPLLFQPLHYDVARKAKKLPPGMVPENFPPSTFAVWLLNFFGRVFFSSFISRNSLLWISWTCRKSAFSPLFSWPFLPFLRPSRANSWTIKLDKCLIPSEAIAHFGILRLFWGQTITGAKHEKEENSLGHIFFC